jgi:hypothetical protein
MMFDNDSPRHTHYPVLRIDGALMPNFAGFLAHFVGEVRLPGNTYLSRRIPHCRRADDARGLPRATCARWCPANATGRS